MALKGNIRMTRKMAHLLIRPFCISRSSPFFIKRSIYGIAEISPPEKLNNKKNVGRNETPWTPLNKDRLTRSTHPLWSFNQLQPHTIQAGSSAVSSGPKNPNQWISTEKRGMSSNCPKTGALHWSAARAVKWLGSAGETGLIMVIMSMLHEKFDVLPIHCWSLI